jgi:L-fuconolactonase
LDLVDAHHHVWDLRAHEQPWLQLPGHEALLRDYSEADLRPLASQAGVTASVVVQTVTETSETTELLELASASDLVAGVVGWVDLEAADVADAIAALQARPDGQLLRGIRHPVVLEDDPDWLRRAAVQHGMRAVGAAGLCYDILVPADLLPAAADAVAACPGVLFVINHLGIPQIGPQLDELWMRDIRELAAFPNTVCKLSGVLGEPPPGGERGGEPLISHLVPYYETALAAFGPDRLMFGTDWPACTLSSSYQGVLAVAQALTAGLSQVERSAVFAATARGAYRLSA